jgi:hypothetical protein
MSRDLGIFFILPVWQTPREGIPDLQIKFYQMLPFFKAFFAAAGDAPEFTGKINRLTFYRAWGLTA